MCTYAPPARRAVALTTEAMSSWDRVGEEKKRKEEEDGKEKGLRRSRRPGRDALLWPDQTRTAFVAMEVGCSPEAGGGGQWVGEPMGFIRRPGPARRGERVGGRAGGRCCGKGGLRATVRYVRACARARRQTGRQSRGRGRGERRGQKQKEKKNGRRARRDGGRLRGKKGKKGSRHGLRKIRS